ncbi:MAG: type II secretion system protein J [bacterium]
MKISKLMNVPGKNSEKGMTLLEVILVMVMVAILAGFVSKIISFEIDTYNLISQRNELLQNARLALQMMTTDIRQMMAPDSIYQASADSIRFDDINDTMISYRYVGDQLWRNQDQLMTHVPDFQFDYFDKSGTLLNTPVMDPSLIRSVSLSLTILNQAQRVTLKSKITPRNF